jgi:hypothetical protein
LEVCNYMRFVNMFMKFSNRDTMILSTLALCRKELIRVDPIHSKRRVEHPSYGRPTTLE